MNNMPGRSLTGHRRYHPFAPNHLVSATFTQEGMFVRALSRLMLASFLKWTNAMRVRA